jgi:hypothetical protein
VTPQVDPSSDTAFRLADAYLRAYAFAHLGDFEAGRWIRPATSLMMENWAASGLAFPDRHVREWGEVAEVLGELSRIWGDLDESGRMEAREFFARWIPEDPYRTRTLDGYRENWREYWEADREKSRQRWAAIRKAELRAASRPQPSPSPRYSTGERPAQRYFRQQLNYNGWFTGVEVTT